MDTYYLYIVKYAPDTFWLSTHSITNDLGDFTGMIYFYNDDGIYIAKATMQNGSSTSSERHPCDDPEDDGSGSGDDSAGGGSGCTMTLVWYECGGPNSSTPHPPAGTGQLNECGVEGGSGSGFYWVESGNCVGNKSMSDFLRQPCQGSGGASGGGTASCIPDPNVPCVFPMQLDQNCDCVEGQAIENGEVGVVTPNMGKDINICLGNTFTVDEINTLNANPTIDLLYDYLKDSAGNCIDENLEFGELAANALLEGSEVDFSKQIIIESSIPTCVKNIVNNLLNENAYLDLGDMPDEVKQELNLSGFILDLFNNSDKFQLTFKSASLATPSGDYKNSETVSIPDPNNPGKFKTTITIDSSYITNATDLAIARTIIHESIHAYIAFIYQDDIFNDLSQAYLKLLEAAGYPSDTNPAQHQIIATNFVAAIANSLADWDNNSLSDSNYYDYMSWSGGMLATSTFTNMSVAFQQNTIDANVAEGNAGPNGAYNSVNSKGTKNCN